MKVLFLDTNVFMQCKDLKELPWKDVVNSNEILLLIPLTVEKEIDKQKGEGGSRRGRRARAISSFFKKIVTSGETNFVIKKANPTIKIAFSDIHPLKVHPDDALDATRPDDLIIAEILQYQRSNPDHDVHFLTHDSYPMRACQRLGIAFQDVPDEWLLEPEDDPRDKELKELRLKITKLEHNYPKIEMQIRNSDNNEVNNISTELTVYAGLTEAQVKELVAEAVARFPMKTEFKVPNKPKTSPSSAFSDRNFARLLGSQEEYQEPSESLIKKYQNESYPKWVEGVNKLFKNLHKRLIFEQSYFTLDFVLSNSGSVPAKNLIIEFQALGGTDIMLEKHRKDFFGENSIELPFAPKAPEGKWVKKSFGLYDPNIHGLVSRVDQPLFTDPTQFMRREKELNSFYWKEGNSGGFMKEISAECREFRHQVDPEVFEIVAIIPMDQILKNGAVSCLVTAKNLPTPFKKILPISVNYVQSSNTFDIASSLLSKAHQEK